MKSSLYILFYGLTIFIVRKTDGRITEKTAVVCNGPCGQLPVSCSAGQKIAIRDVVYRVQDKTDSCKPFAGCSNPNQAVCCETTKQDCVFPYSPAHLNVLHRNCSGNKDCVIQTERSDKETVQCSSTDINILSSNTVLNYVCVNDDVVLDICSPKETVVQGKTLFAIIDPRGSTRPMKGSVCNCLAESTKWPTTNSIAVFLVDMRLNAIGSNQCANTSLTVRSGSNRRSLDCQSTKDPRVNFPFVAVLNDSNIATLRFQINEHLPEFVWLGFEANEDEDIRLTCKQEGLVPLESATDVPTIQDVVKAIDFETDVVDDEINSQNRDEETKKGKKKQTPNPAIIGGVAGGFVLVIIIVVIIATLRKKYQLCNKEKKEETEIDSDMVYYSTTDEELKNMAALGNNTASGRNSAASTQELYISAEEVVANKRKNPSKRVRIISTPDFLDEHGEEYISAFEVRERKRQSRKEKSNFKNNKTDAANGNNTSDNEDNNYDRLDRLSTVPPKAILDSYDQLAPEVTEMESYSCVPGDKVQRSDSKCLLINNNKSKKKGTDNTAYEDTNVTDKTLQLRPPKPGDEGRSLYFELERCSGASYSDVGTNDNPYDTAFATPEKPSTESQPKPRKAPLPSVPSNEDGEIYNDATSEAASKQENASVSKDSKVPNGKSSPVRQTTPVAAPRRKSREPILSPDYDVAKPIV